MKEDVNLGTGCVLVVLVLALACALYAFFGYLLLVVWREVAVAVFGAPALSYKQMVLAVVGLDIVRRLLLPSRSKGE